MIRDYQPPQLTAKHRAIMLELRPARYTDAGLLRKWRSTERELAPGEHETWMELRVLRGYPVHLVMIGGGREFGAIGMVCFHMAKDDVMTYGINLWVAPEFRHQGLGTMLLMAASDVMDDCTLTTQFSIKDTVARKLYKSAGYQAAGYRERCVIYKRKPA